MVAGITDRQPILDILGADFISDFDSPNKKNFSVSLSLLSSIVHLYSALIYQVFPFFFSLLDSKKNFNSN